MKNLRFFFLGLLCLNLFMFTSCDSDDEVDEPEIVDIVATAQATDNLSSLVEAVIQADLVTTLQGDGPFTVFAPTNAAFQDLLDSNPDWNSLSDIDNTTLTNVLTFHVVAGNVKAADLADGYTPTVATGPDSDPLSLRVDLSDGVVFNAGAKPVTTDVEATNGTVHIIDKVMLPPNVVDHALNNPIFSSLVAALTRADLGVDYVSLLSGAGPFTVFAPTNTAFQALLDSNDDWSELADIPVDVLNAVLQYHVVSGANVQSGELNDNQFIETFGGATLTVDLSDGAKLTTTSGQSVNIAVTDVQGTNGVVHVVDQVLVPIL